jgi:hypothetical protein
MQPRSGDSTHRSEVTSFRTDLIPWPIFELRQPSLSPLRGLQRVCSLYPWAIAHGYLLTPLRG